MRNVTRLSLIAAILTLPAVLHAQAQPQGNRVRTVTDTILGGVGGVAVDRLGMIYVADFGEHVFKVTPFGAVSVFATGLYGSSGNAIDAAGNLFQANFFGNSISKIDRNGSLETFAEGFAGPVGVAIDPAGGLFVCNCSSNTLSRVSAAGEVAEFAASGLFNCPNGITRTPDGNLYVVNFSDNLMLKVTPEGSVREFVRIPGGGNGHVTFARGALFATSFQGHRIYRVSLEGEVTLFAGTGALGERDGSTTEATFSWPNGIATGPTGDRLFVNDFLNRFPPNIEAPPQPKSILRQITLASFSSVLTAALRDAGVDGMKQAYREWKSDPATSSLFTELEVNAMGYQLMNQGNLTAAVELFRLNVDSYPQSFNVYDSLAEAYMNAGQNELAVEFYEKSLELNPANDNAVQMLRRLRGQSG